MEMWIKGGCVDLQCQPVVEVISRGFCLNAGLGTGLESRCFSVKHAGAPSIGLYFAEKIMSAFEQILSNKKYFHHLIICQILFLTKIRWKKFTCNSILIVDSEIQLLFLWDWTSSEHRDSTLAPHHIPQHLFVGKCNCQR